MTGPIPQTEPNAIPDLFTGAQDWRDTYTAYVLYYKMSPKTFSDEVQLRIRLKRLGYDGKRLEDELTYVKEN